MRRVELALIATILGVFYSAYVEGHGRLADPPARNAMWMYGFKNPVNYNPNENNCGGTKNQWSDNGGRCGLCGDPYQGPRKHEAGYPGGYANGVIGRVYKQGQTINIMVEITANHFGWFEFRLCPNNDPRRAVTQQCFNKYVLADRSGNTRHRLNLTGYKGTVKLQLVLPSDVVCSQCVLQWFWYGGNSRDRIEQETFVNCADVVITKPDGSLPAGMKMPEIPAKAYEPIPEAKVKFGEGKLIGLPGEWDCVVPPPHGNTEKKQVFYEWCIENCLYAQPHQRSCPVETCRCFRTDYKMAVEEERELLGVKDAYPNTVGGSDSGSTQKIGYLEGTWKCDVASPFNRDPSKKKQFEEWCQTNCIDALPYERDCPASHCECHRTDRRMSEADEKRMLQRTPAPRGVNPKPKAVPNAQSDDKNWKSASKIRPNPVGLQGSWDCDVKSPYNSSPDKRLFYYEWCLENCINAKLSDRYCAETHCDCYRTDRRLSPDEIRSQLSGTNQVKVFSDADKQRGIPPSLLNIVEYAGKLDTHGKQPGLEGTWDCSVVFPFNKDPVKKDFYYTWCLDHCIKPQPNDRYCPDTHCRCYRTDKHQSDAENKRQLQVGMNVKNIIHAESGERGYLATNTEAPRIGKNAAHETEEDPTFGYTCDVVPPFDNSNRKSTVLKYCFDSCVYAPANQRNCPETHCRCYEKANPSNVLKTYKKPTTSAPKASILRSSYNRRSN